MDHGSAAENMASQPGDKDENSGCHSNEYIVRTRYIFTIASIKEPIKEEFKIVSDLILSFLREVVLIPMLEMVIHEMSLVPKARIGESLQ